MTTETKPNTDGTLYEWISSLPAGTIISDNASDWTPEQLIDALAMHGDVLDAPYIPEDANGYLMEPAYRVKVDGHD